MSDGRDERTSVRHAAVRQTGRVEKRWWMWGLALATLFVTAHLRIRMGRPWDHRLLAESVAALALVVVTCGKWRGRYMPTLMAVGAAMCVVKAVRVALGT